MYKNDGVKQVCLTLNQRAQGSSPWKRTIPNKSERTSFRRCVRICFLYAVYEYEIERALRREKFSLQGFSIDDILENRTN